MLPSTKNISTIILDEAGSTKESDMLPLMRLKPSNIIMIGDPKQLSAFCDLKIEEEQKTCLTISPLERLIKCGKEHAILTTQYRMRSDMCKVVSKLFYNGILVSDESRNYIPTKKSGLSIKWVDVKEKEQYDNKFESYYNDKEIEEVIKICNKHIGEEIMILTSYNSQLKELNKLLGNDTDSNILVRTIDASQGSESSIVILSLTRSNDENKIGFLSDDKRMCVALSRAKNLLYIVGNKDTFKNCGHKRWTALVSLLEKYQ
jgi:superfamily I DNA and/or RNA helicase